MKMWMRCEECLHNCAQVRMNPSSRGPQCTVTFDGRHLRRYERGDCLRISTGAYSVPCVSSSNSLCDWFQSLDECFHWNHSEQRLPSNINLVQLAGDASDSEGRFILCRRPHKK